MALQVEKTSKRGGRIIHEKDIMLPPPLGSQLNPPGVKEMLALDEPPAMVPPKSPPSPKAEMSITEIMKTPSKVVLLRVSFLRGYEYDFVIMIQVLVDTFLYI
jgi:splicing factor 45